MFFCLLSINSGNGGGAELSKSLTQDSRQLKHRRGIVVESPNLRSDLSSSDLETQRITSVMLLWLSAINVGNNGPSAVFFCLSAISAGDKKEGQRSFGFHDIYRVLLKPPLTQGSSWKVEAATSAEGGVVDGSPNLRLSWKEITRVRRFSCPSSTSEWYQEGPERFLCHVPSENLAILCSAFLLLVELA